MKEEVIIKPARREDLEVLNKKLRSYLPNFHEKKIAWQEKGEASWLIAWIADEPVGHILIKWHGIEDEFVIQHEKEKYPYIQNLGVKINHQRKGIGTKLVHFAENMIQDKNYTRVGMSVSIENDFARKLYEKLGYKDWCKGTYRSSWKFFDKEGNEIEESEECTYLVKELHEKK